MTIRTNGYFIALAVLTILAMFSGASIISYVDPNSASVYVLVSLYTSVFLAVTGFATLLGLGVRHYWLSERFASSAMVSFRQGLLLGGLVVISLILQADRLLYWWVELSIVLFLLVIEILFNL